MTVLVGILCQDGVVLGSDSSATFVAGQMRTIEQACQKLYAVGNTVMFALIPSGVVAEFLVKYRDEQRATVLSGLSRLLTGWPRLTAARGESGTAGVRLRRTTERKNDGSRKGSV